MSAQGPSPHNLDAEEALLGAMLLTPAAIVTAIEGGVEASDFHRPAHQHVFHAIVSLHGRGVGVDPLTVADELRREGLLDVIGGADGAKAGKSLLVSLQSGTPSTGNAARYAEIVTRDARRRELIASGHELVSLAHSSDDVHDVVEQAVGWLRRVESRAATLVGHRRPRAVRGGEFILDAPAGVPAVWGSGEEVAWAQGETLGIVGPEGVGKTTVAQQLVLGRLGLRSEVLGMRVVHDQRRVLYVAADRPKQVARSFRRMVREADREVLDERLVVWRGPLPADVVADPDVLLRLAEEHGAGTVFIDSLKDVARELSKEDAGSTLNSAMQRMLAEGIEVCALHHQRKQASEGGKPKTLADVYGSRLITAGMGSVVLLWGEPGDTYVEFAHLKPPAELIGPLKVFHDHQAGRSTLVEGSDPWELLVAAPRGLTAQELACKLYEKSTPSKNEIEQARRKLNTLVRCEQAHVVDGQKGGVGGGQPTRYFAITSRMEAVS